MRLRLLGTIALIAIASCGEKATREVPTPAPYIYDKPDDETSTIDLTSLQAEIVGTIPTIINMDVEAVFTAYDAFLAEGDETCPGVYVGGDEEEDYYQSWESTCTSDNAAFFSGYGSYEYQSHSEDQVGHSKGIYMSGAMTNAAGQTFTGAGWVGSYQGSGEDNAWHSWSKTIEGSYKVEGSEVDWLSTSLRPAFTISASSDNQSYRQLSITGGLGGLTGNFDSISFSNFSMLSDHYSGCSEPGGQISIRASDGYWYDFVFDGPTEGDDEVDPQKCDGCAAAWYRGSEVGKICLATESLLQWETSPW